MAEPTELFAGVDWDGNAHALCVIDATGQRIAERRVEHTAAGIAELDTILTDVATGAELRIAIERGEGLLVERLQTAGWPVFCLSPKLSARARERYVLSGSKSDRFDAYVLADVLRHQHGQWRPLATASPLLAELRALSRDRERLTERQRQTEARLRATLETFYPAPLHLFSTLDRDITLAFLREYPTPEAAARVGVARMERFCRRHGYSGRTEPQVLVARLRRYALTASPGTTAGRELTCRLLAEELALLNGHLRMFHSRLAKRLPAHPDASLLLSFPGVGPVIAATLIAELGEDRSRYPTAAALLRDAGLVPVTRASGRSRQVRFRYAANHRLRHAFDRWMITAIRVDDGTRRTYEAARGRGHSQYRALRGVASRWARVLWRCWTDHTDYDPNRHAEQPRPQQEAAA